MIDTALSARRWTVYAWATAAATTVGIAACMWGIPLPLTDNVAFLLEVQPRSFGELFRERVLATNYFRPLYWVQLKALLEIAAGGHYFLAFRGFHVLQLAITVFLFTRVLRVGTAAAFVAFSIALMALFGLHTLTLSLIEGPLTAILCCTAAVWLSFGERPSPWRTAASIGLLVYGALSVELGLLVWVVYVSAWIVGCRGLSRTALTATTALVAAYFILRFAVLPSADSGLVHRETGVGFGMLEPSDAAAALGGPVGLYAYNVGSSVMSVLLSEPRAGVWEFMRRYTMGEVAPWQWIHVVSSAVSSLCLAWFVAARRRAWWKGAFTREDRLVWVFAAVLAASAVMSFAYTREAVLGPAGILYAMALFAACHAMLTRLPALRWPARSAVWVLLLAISVGWTARAAGLAYVLRDSAFERRNDWAVGIEYLAETGHLPEDPAGRALVDALQDDALRRFVPSPRWAQPWIEEYADRLF